MSSISEFPQSVYRQFLYLSLVEHPLPYGPPPKKVPPRQYNSKNTGIPGILTKYRDSR